MEINRKNLSPTHAIISANIFKADYAENVDKILKNYKKSAAIPGFRKGMVPMGHIQKQYGDAVKFEEINKMVEEKLNNYIATEKLDILGQPVPVITEGLDLKNDDFTLEFEIGIAPEFSLDLSKIEIPYYKIVADNELINEQIEHIQKHFGTKIVNETFAAGNDVKGTVTNEEMNIDKNVDFNCSIFKNKNIETSLIGKKSGDVVTIPTKDLFENEHKLMDFIQIDHSLIHGLDIELTFTITDIFDIQKAEINQELFDKMYGAGIINSEEELRAKTKTDIESQYVKHTDDKFLHDLDEKLIETTTMALPKEFLSKWIQFTAKQEISIEEATQEFEKSENTLKFQLIEAKIVKDNNLTITFDELKDFTAAQIKQQMLMYGMQDVDDKMLEETTIRILSKREEVDRQSKLLKDQKMLIFFKETVKMSVKEVTVDEYIKINHNE